jgi:hypothetical protein
MSVNDFTSAHRGTSLYLAYQQQKERLAGRVGSAALNTLGIQSIP